MVHQDVVEKNYIQIGFYAVINLYEYFDTVFFPEIRTCLRFLMMAACSEAATRRAKANKLFLRTIGVSDRRRDKSPTILLFNFSRKSDSFAKIKEHPRSMTSKLVQSLVNPKASKS